MRTTFIATMGLLAILTGMGCGTGPVSNEKTSSQGNRPALGVSIGIHETPGIDSVSIVVEEVFITSAEGLRQELLSATMPLDLDVNPRRTPKLLRQGPVEFDDPTSTTITITLDKEIQVTSRDATEVGVLDVVEYSFTIPATAPQQTTWLAFRLDIGELGAGSAESEPIPSLELTSTVSLSDADFDAFHAVFGDKTSYMLELAHVVAEFEVVEIEEIDLDFYGDVQIEGTISHVRPTRILKGSVEDATLEIRSFGNSTLYVSHQPTFVSGERFIAPLERLDDGRYRVIAGDRGKIASL